MDRRMARMLGGQLAARLQQQHAAAMAMPAQFLHRKDAEARAQRSHWTRAFEAQLGGVHALLRLSLASGIREFKPAPRLPRARPSRATAREDRMAKRSDKPHGARRAGGGLGRLKNGNPAGDFRLSPRCGAKTRCGGACRQPAMANGRCRLHGGKSTGARTAAGRARIAAAHTRHGRFSHARRAGRRRVRETVRALRAATAAVRALVYGARENPKIAVSPHAQRRPAAQPPCAAQAGRGECAEISTPRETGHAIPRGGP